MGQRYNRQFYLDQKDESRRSAGEVIPLILSMFRPRSVIDIGCGLGTWLAVFEEHGIDDIQGMDGAYVDRSLLQIPEARFKTVDLNRTFCEGIQRRFDCAMSLEVAEHLEPDSSKPFVQGLTRLSDVVLFSAGVPKQGGTGHINEKWLEFWAVLFRDAGYMAVDCLRPVIWTNDRIAWWYRQNMIFFVSESRVAEVFPEWSGRRTNTLPLSLVHPELLLWAEARNKWIGKTFEQDLAQYRNGVATYRNTSHNK